MESQRYCFALDLIPDLKLKDGSEVYPQKIWPEIMESIKESGIEQLEIYRVENRLYMIMEVAETLSLEKKAQVDAAEVIFGI